MRDRMRVVDAPALAAHPAIVQRGVISLVSVGASPADEALVLAARSHSAGLVLLRPDRAVEDGTLVS